MESIYKDYLVIYEIHLLNYLFVSTFSQLKRADGVI